MDGRTKHFIAKHLQPFACPSVAIHRMQTILTYKRDSIQDTLNTVPSAPLASVRHLFPWYFGYERIPCWNTSVLLGFQCTDCLRNGTIHQSYARWNTGISYKRRQWKNCQLACRRYHEGYIAYLSCSSISYCALIAFHEDFKLYPLI